MANSRNVWAVFCGVVAFCAAIGESAEPVRRSHPALKHDLDPAARPRWETAAAPALARSEAELAAMVPRQTPFITCDCPACGARTYTRNPDRILWQFEFPNRITCRACRTTFPNEKFPENGQAKFLNTLGESIEIPYFVNAEGKRFFIAATIDTWRNEELVNQIEAMAKLYAVTKNEACASRIVAMLAAYAEHFPHYLVKDFRTAIDDPPGPRGQQRSWYEFVSSGGPWLVDGKPRGSRPSEPQASSEQTTTPYGWTQSRWGWRRWEGETPMNLLRAYDLTYDSPAWNRAATDGGRDVRKQVEDGLFRNATAYLLEYPFWYHVHNNAGMQVAEIVRTGMVLNEPSFAAFGHRWGRAVLEQYVFSRDGGYGESPGYFYVFLATQADNFVALKEAAAYFGGDAGDDPQTAQARKSIAFLDRSQAAIESVRLPNGSSLPVSDNRHDEFADPTFRPGVRGTPRESSTDVLLPGYGHALLGAGTGDRQVQAHLHFSPFKEAIHTHRDALSLMLWAFGSELYTDVGYNRTKYRNFASTTLSHNTVVVDRKEQGGESTKGRLSAYEHDPRGWSFIQVEAANAYGPPLTRYRRTLLLNTRDLERPYLVDVFEVNGGTMHDYALHGPTVFDSTAEVDLPLTKLPGPHPLSTATDGTVDVTKDFYGLFTGVRSGTPRDSFAVTYRLVQPYQLPEFTPNSRYPAGKSFHYEVDPQSYSDRGEIGVASRFVGFAEKTGEKWRVLLGETPSLLRGGLMGGPLTEKLKRPSLLVRHEGQGPLSSVFVVVHEPYYRSTKIVAVRRLNTTQPNAVALEIEKADRVDTVLLALDGTQATAESHAASLEGRLGVVERAKGKSADGWLVGGTSLRQGDFALSNSTASYQGTFDAVTSVWDGGTENAFITAAKLPEGAGLAGRWMIVHHANGTADEGYRIDRIERRDGRSVVHLTDDPGLRIVGDATEEIFFPRRRWTGPNRFTILTQTALDTATPK